MISVAQTIIDASVRRALEEDIGSGDLTAALIPASASANAVVISREHAVLCGSAWFDTVFRQLDDTIRILWHVRDGEQIEPNQPVCELSGSARHLLTGERTALNFLQTLSGTATSAQRYASAVAGTHARVLDTRKTIPGLREEQKYAVRCGGCHNHRHGLYDGILIKENHIAAAGSLAAAVSAARNTATDLPVEVEVETLDDVRAAIDAGADILLLDNMDLATLEQAVGISAGRARLEASGNITLDNIKAVAASGVDFISIGSLTKHVRAIDLSMRFSAG